MDVSKRQRKREKAADGGDAAKEEPSPKIKSKGKLGAFRSSLKEVGRIGNKRRVEPAIGSGDQVEQNSASPPDGKTKTSKTSSLVRKLSIGKYRSGSSKTPSPTPSKSSQEELAAMLGRQGPDGEDGRRGNLASPSPVGSSQSEGGDQFGDIDEETSELTIADLRSPEVDEPTDASPRHEADTSGTLPIAPPSNADASSELNAVNTNAHNGKISSALNVSATGAIPKIRDPASPEDPSVSVPSTDARQADRRLAWLTQNEDAQNTKQRIREIAGPILERQRKEAEIVRQMLLAEKTQESDGAVYATEEKKAEEMPAASISDAIAEARNRLTESLSGGAAGAGAAAAQQVAERREHLYKVLVIGELGTGKTSIIKRYVHQFFSQHYRATIGVDFALKVIQWDTNTIIRLQLWDIAGQERFGNMTRVYYKEAVGAFIVFDVTRAATFDAVVKWKQDLDAKVQLPDGSPIPCVLLANKCDQQKEGLVNTPAKMDEYCKEKGFAAWFETSAKENINIEEAARCLVKKILSNDKLSNSDDSRDNDRFNLDSRNQDTKSSSRCAC